jgi:LysM repeat protein
MKSLCTKGLLYLSLALLVVGAAACTQSKPQVPTPTLVPLANDTIVAPSGGDTPAAPSGNETTAPVDNSTLVPPLDNGTPVAPQDQTPGAEVTPIIVEPTLLPTPTTVGDTGQGTEATPVPPPDNSGTNNGGNTGSSAACSNPYTVQGGDWFYAVARKCGVSPQDLLAANPGLDPNVLRPGQVLNVPGGGAPNNGNPPPPNNGQTQPPSGGNNGQCSNPYVVQRGDTLFHIAQICGSSVGAIMSANGLGGTNIYTGQQLTIP